MGRAVSGLQRRAAAIVPGDHPGGPTSHPRLAVAAVLGAMTLVVLDAGMVNVALPLLAAAFDIAPARAVLATTIYQLAVAMALLPAAALGERAGFRRVFTAGVALFTAASLISMLSETFWLLLTARFAQGLGASAILALGVALLRHVVPPSRLGAAIGWNALTVALASAGAPALGAGLLAAASWPWLFSVNLLLGALVLTATRALPALRGHGGPLDVRGALLAAALFGLVAAAAQCLPVHVIWAATLGAAAAAALAGLMRHQRRLDGSSHDRVPPLIPLDLLRRPSLRISVLASVLCFGGQTAALIALPFHLHHDLHQDALMTGLLMMPWPLAVALTAPVAGQLADRWSAALPCAVGGALLALGLAGMAAGTDPGRIPVLVACVMVCGVGFGLFQVANNRNMFMSAPPARSAAAGGLQGTARLTGQTLGAVTAGLVFSSTLPDAASPVIFVVGAILTLLAGLVSLRR